MSDNLSDSVGLCLSDDLTDYSLTGETGEARSCTSVTVESLSLTKISLPYRERYLSDNPPVLLTLPLDDPQVGPTAVFDKPPNLLSLSQHITSTSGVTPSGTTLEGTLDDIPDFQEILPLTSVVVIKNDPEIYTSKSPESSPLQNAQLTVSPPSITHPSPFSRDSVPTSESKFMQEVKRHSTTKPTSSIKSLASTIVAKTSTSGVTVVEMKSPPLKSDESKSIPCGHSLKDNHDHSVGSVKSDTMRDISDCMSSRRKSIQPSEMTIFKNFDPKLPQNNRPFLLCMPVDEEILYDDTQKAKTDQKKVLGETKSSGNKKRANSKSWKTMEDKSRTASINSITHTSQCENTLPCSVISGHKSKKHHKKAAVNFMDHDGIKKIVKEEMNAVVTMQNEIWHKILDSFVDKAAGKQSIFQEQTVLSLKEQQKPGQKNTMMLKLPIEQTETYYQPLNIPILKPEPDFLKEGGILKLQMPADFDEEIVNYKKVSKNEDVSVVEEITNEDKNNIIVISPVKQSDVSIQTINVPADVHLVEVGVQSYDKNECNENIIRGHDVTENDILSSNKPMRHVIMKPPAENLEYQKAVTKHEIPLKVMEECKMLLESIQSSAKEITDMKNDASKRPPLCDSPSQKSSKVTREPKCDGYAKSKHEIFVEQFFSNNKQKINLNRYIDIVDLPHRASSSGHFDVHASSHPKKSKTKKTPEFIHTTDLMDNFKTKKIDKPLLIDKKIKTSELFIAKREISRSPVSSISRSALNDSGPKTMKPSSNQYSPPKTPINVIEVDKFENQQAPFSPVSIQKSESVSSIGKYLSQKSKTDDVSIPDKTISKEEEIVSDRTISDTELADDSNDVIADVLQHSTPKKQDDVDPSPTESLVSKDSFVYNHPKPTNPLQFSKYIATNLSKIKNAYSEVHQKDIERSNRVNMLLHGRHNPIQTVDEKSHQAAPNLPPPKVKKSPTKTVVKVPTVPKKNKRKPIDIVDVDRPTSKASIISSDTSIPTNTEELMKAALADSDNTIPSQLGGFNKKALLPAKKPKAGPSVHVSVFYILYQIGAEPIYDNALV